MKRLAPGFYFERRMVGGHAHSCWVFRHTDTGRWHWWVENTDMNETLFPPSRELLLMADARHELAQAVARLEAA